jgi:hypothetical protein
LRQLVGFLVVERP